MNTSTPTKPSLNAVSRRPNVLILMTDQQRGQTLHPDSPCITPNLDRLIARGARFPRAYTTNAVCSPARASLMTGLLPHNHGVLTVTHCVDEDQSVLRTEHPHFAQRLQQAGYHTGLFGKWHVERTNKLEDFGWNVNGVTGGSLWKEAGKRLEAQAAAKGQYKEGFDPVCWMDNPKGYKRGLLYGVDDRPDELHMATHASEMGMDFIRDAATGDHADQPWCCFVSVIEPHDPFQCSRWAYDQYDVNALELPANAQDNLADKPGLYRKAARIFAHLTERQRKEALACYYALMTDVDKQFGRVLDLLEETGQLENTIVVHTSDHGEHCGAHGLYMKNIGAFEETYHIPMVFAGPGVAEGQVSSARVGLHDVAPTLCELAGAEPIVNSDSRSFAAVVRDPARPHADDDWQTGYAEFEGTRYHFTQRICWDGDLKFVWNGFDEDELYDLAADPGEMINLIADPAHREDAQHMMNLAWDYAAKTGNHTLINTNYPILRHAIVGPGDRKV